MPAKDQDSTQSISDEEPPEYWNIKIYENREEKETLRGITELRTDQLMEIFEREGTQAQSMAYTDDGTFIHGEGRCVNMDNPIPDAIRCNQCDDVFYDRSKAQMYRQALRHQLGTGHSVCSEDLLEEYDKATY